jgi:protease-4
MLFKKKRSEPSGGGEHPGDPWERQLVEKVVMASMAETRRARRWGVFFKLATFVYLFALLWLLLPEDVSESVKKAESHTALVEVKGLIAPETQASADKIVEGLRDALEDTKTKAVILRINSPGGSPVQAGYVYSEIRRLREKHADIPVYAVIADIGASGAYYIAAATDAIYADKASIVGSIGVLMNGFGFVETLQELGIERRLLTAGERKGMLDPFSPMNSQDEEYIRSLLETLHQQFIAAVQEGRKGKLKPEAQEQIFSGLFWSGEESLALGLVDGLGSAGYVAREVVGVDRMVDFTPEEDWLDRLSKRLGAGAVEAFARLSGSDGTPALR